MKDLMALRWVRWTVGALIAAAVFLLAFGLGVSVGYQKAIFSSEWGMNYERNFSGPPHGMTAGTESENLHGAAGTILDISGRTISVKDDDNDERSVLVATDTIIKKMDATVALDTLTVGDRIIAIGAPNTAGQVEAHFIRVFPPGGTSSPPFGPPLP